MAGTGVVDLFLVYHFVKRLGSSFTSWPAYKTGVIDEDGRVMVPSDKRSKAQSDSFQMYDVMLLNLKRLLALVPGGQSPVVSVAAALLLLKEPKLVKEGKEPFIAAVLALDETPELVELYTHIVENEGGIASVVGTGNVAGVDGAHQHPREQWKSRKGRKVKHVDRKQFDALKALVRRRAYITDRYDPVVDALYECSQKCRDYPLAICEAQTSSMVHLRNSGHVDSSWEADELVEQSIQLWHTRFRDNLSRMREELGLEGDTLSEPLTEVTEYLPMVLEPLMQAAQALAKGGSGNINAVGNAVKIAGKEIRDRRRAKAAGTTVARVRYNDSLKDRGLRARTRRGFRGGRRTIERPPPQPNPPLMQGTTVRARKPPVRARHVQPAQVSTMPQTKGMTTRSRRANWNKHLKQKAAEGSALAQRQIERLKQIRFKQKARAAAAVQQQQTPRGQFPRPPTKVRRIGASDQRPKMHSSELRAPYKRHERFQSSADQQQSQAQAQQGIKNRMQPAPKMGHRALVIRKRTKHITPEQIMKNRFKDTVDKFKTYGSTLAKHQYNTVTGRNFDKDVRRAPVRVAAGVRDLARKFTAKRQGA